MINKHLRLLVNKIKYLLINKPKYIYLRYKYPYDSNQIDTSELEKFNNNGFSYEKGLNKLNSILKNKEFNIAFDSIHWLLFSCLSIQNHKINRILEIGTYTGEATFILSELFPDASITTIELPYDDPIFTTTYSRNSEADRKKFMELQQANLNPAKDRIKLIQKNSFFLLDVVNDKFDLIWVDAGHLFPEIAWDISNAYYLCKKGGYLMFDDIIKHKNGFSNDYVSPDAYNVLKYMSERSEDKVTYFYKRINSKSYKSFHPKRIKYVAFMQKK